MRGTWEGLRSMRLLSRGRNDILGYGLPASMTAAGGSTSDPTYAISREPVIAISIC